MQNLLLFFYLLALSFIFMYSFIQFLLIISYLRNKKNPILFPETISDFPFVTIQLPLYNEKYVVERLMDCVAKMKYPKEFLEIQLLDDSTDETTELIQKKLAEWNFPKHFRHLRRSDRKGFKAGALAFGLADAQGEFIAIFDADFLPETDFLEKTLPHFQNNKVGVVQTRWTHLNENYSFLTKLQAFGLDAHFYIEQGGRKAGKHFINFNGTAGIWRKTCIEDAGGWSADTLTEDLDLSYRAQVRGWEFVYREDIGSPAELPVAMSAIKSQQYRWMKGGAECFVKNGTKLLKNPKVRWSDKFHGFFHLLNSSVFTALVFLALLSFPLLFTIKATADVYKFYRWTAIFQVNWLILGVFYWISFRKNGTSIVSFFWRFFWFLTLMMGMSLHNSIAVIEGWLGRKTPFVRTPKFGKEDWKKNTYISQKLGSIFWAEMALSFFFLLLLFADFFLQNYGMMLFHFMLFLGFASVVFWTIKEVKLK